MVIERFILKNVIPVVLLLLSLLFPRKLEAQPASSVRVDTVSHGVRLSLVVPRRSYPRNALVVATVRVTNVSRHAVFLSGNNYPTVDVFNGSHQDVYDSAEPFGTSTFVMPSGGPHRPPRSLAVGASLTAHPFLVLRGRVVQARATVAVHGFEQNITGRQTRLGLSARDEPVVSVQDIPVLHAVVSSPEEADTPLYRIDETQCAAHGGVSLYFSQWASTRSSTLAPPFPRDCDIGSTRHWIAYAGYLDHSIAEIDWDHT